MIGKSIHQLELGQRAVVVKTITAADVRQFANLTGDRNPLHMDGDLAKASRFGEPIAHGMLTASVISAAIGTKLPGPGTIYLSQDLRFLRPVKIGDTLIARIEVMELNREKTRVRLKTTLNNQRGEQVIDGTALVIPPMDHRKEP